MATAADILTLRIRCLELETLALLGVDADTLRLYAQESPWRKASTESLICERDYAVRELSLLEGDDRLSLQVAYLEMRNAADAELERRSRATQKGTSGSGGIDAAFVQSVKRAVECYEYLGFRGVNLIRKSDRRYEASCPFHDERRPSFSAWLDHYFCFACLESGDVFTFVQKHDNLPFIDAVREVARYAGLAPPKPRATIYEVDL